MEPCPVHHACASELKGNIEPKVFPKVPLPNSFDDAVQLRAV